MNNLIMQLRTYARINWHIKINLQTVGKLLTSLLICFVLGLNVGNLANAASSSTILSIAKGGTGTKRISGKGVIWMNSGLVGISISDKLVDSYQSLTFLTSNALFKAIGLQNLNKANILTTSGYFDMNYTTSSPRVKQVGNIMVIEGPFKVLKDIPSYTRIDMLTIKSGFRPHDYIPVTCSNNFFGVTHAGEYPPTLDCAYTGGIVAVQSNLAIKAGTYIDLNFIYVLP
ncbi:MAG: hypothetical protein LBT99_04540 [Bifidobacteriaceae bacterium]|jgi:hypothetical protein|nr:hypothetical protein [Bifidobacteriaceae bacterium]